MQLIEVFGKGQKICSKGPATFGIVARGSKIYK